VEKRGPIKPHKTATVDHAWDAGEALKRCPDERKALRALCAWSDSDGDPDSKSSYKFPHHEVSSDGKVGAANLAACSAGIAALNGGRDGASVPDDDRQGVYRHLAEHLRDGGKEAPELKSATRNDAPMTHEPCDRPAGVEEIGEFSRRSYPVTQIEHRAAKGGKRVVEGHAAVFDQATELMPGLLEQVQRGCFKDSIRTDRVSCLFNHDRNYPLAASHPGQPSTLELAEDTRGLLFRFESAERSYEKDLLISIDRRDVWGASFGFDTLDDRFERSLAAGDRVVMRTLVRARLWDAGPVTEPQYTQTDVGARAARLSGVSYRSLLRAYDRLNAGAGRDEDRALVRSVMRGLAEVADPPISNDRMTLYRQKLELLRLSL